VRRQNQWLRRALRPYKCLISPSLPYASWRAATVHSAMATMSSLLFILALLLSGRGMSHAARRLDELPKPDLPPLPKPQPKPDLPEPEE
jgi:hypothetical protein